ncbi:MAG: hypothetical protein H7Y60_06350 [Rhodospirillaceae bacterium]|nr:hypothetical protein [Rhodospirillales bacterium]
MTTITGTTASERLDGGVDADTITDGGGSDTIYGWDGNDTIIAGSIFYPEANGYGEHDHIYGGNGDDVISATKGWLYGEAGNDWIELAPRRQPETAPNFPELSKRQFEARLFLEINDNQTSVKSALGSGLN